MQSNDELMVRVNFWIPKSLHTRLKNITRHGEFSAWAVDGLEKNAARRETEILEDAKRQGLLAQIQEKVS